MPSTGRSIPHKTAAPLSSLPSLMIPCPVCAGRMAFHGRRVVAADVEDTVFACRQCGAEVIRTSVTSAARKGSAAA